MPDGSRYGSASANPAGAAAAGLPATPAAQRTRIVALVALLAVLAVSSARLILILAPAQPFGVDFFPLWAGARAAMTDPRQLFDFAHVTALQGWPLGPRLRPYVYPPSALILLAPFAWLPMTAAYAAWTASTGAFYLWAARRAGAPIWLVLFPMVTLVAICGQVTYAVGGLCLTALSLRGRPLIAGVLLGMAAALKPQVLVLAPLGLAAARDWRTLLAATATGAGLCAASAALWGAQTWIDWLAALPRFQHEVVGADPGLTRALISAPAAFELMGLPGALAYLLAPPAGLLVWWTFRVREDALARSAAMLGGALLISPYAMHYDAALLAPAAAAGMARIKDRAWLLEFSVCCLFASSMAFRVVPVLMGLAVAVIACCRAAPQQRSQAQLDHGASPLTRFTGAPPTGEHLG